MPFVLGMAAVHAAVGGWLLQLPPPSAAIAPAPPPALEVHWVRLAPELPPPERSPPEPAPPPPPAAARAVRPPPPPARRAPPLVAAAPTPAAAPAPMTAPPPAPAEPVPAAEPVVESVPPPPPVTSPPVPPALPAPPPAPKTVAASAVRYRQPPAPVYPMVSRRAHETGQVVVRVLIDAQGLPAQSRVQQTSGHARLDESALAAVRAARFHPYTEDGTAQPVWVLIPIAFELE